MAHTGKDGTPVEIMSNYFKLLRRPDMHLWQYRVDFIPDIEHLGARKGLVRSHESQIGKYMFDGTLLYAVNKLPQVITIISDSVEIIRKERQLNGLVYCSAFGTKCETKVRRIGCHHQVTSSWRTGERRRCLQPSKAHYYCLNKKLLLMIFLKFNHLFD